MDPRESVREKERYECTATVIYYSPNNSLSMSTGIGTAAYRKYSDVRSVLYHHFLNIFHYPSLSSCIQTQISPLSRNFFGYSLHWIYLLHPLAHRCVKRLGGNKLCAALPVSLRQCITQMFSPTLQHCIQLDFLMNMIAVPTLYLRVY